MSARAKREETASQQDLSKDRELLSRAKAGPEGFGDLFDRYYDRIYTYAYRRVGTRDLAEDIAACTFEDALRGIARFEWQGKPLSAWLYRIVARRIADHYRKLSTLAITETMPAAESDLADGLERRERFSTVRSALARLMPRDREMLQLVFFDELEAAEIAALLGCTTNSVYVRTHRALARLRAVLATEEDEDDKSMG